jgi:hypothetical protein
MKTNSAIVYGRIIMEIRAELMGKIDEIIAILWLVSVAKYWYLDKILKVSQPRMK